MGVNTATGAPQNEAAIASTGGYRHHGYSENKHQKTTVAVGGTGSTALANIDPDADDDTDNRPPFCVVAYIQRVEPWTQAS